MKRQISIKLLVGACMLALFAAGTLELLSGVFGGALAHTHGPAQLLERDAPLAELLDTLGE